MFRIYAIASDDYARRLPNKSDEARDDISPDASDETISAQYRLSRER